MSDQHQIRPTPRVEIIRGVLEAARDAGDPMIAEACGRLLEANLLGWRKHAMPEDRAIVEAFIH